MLKTKSSTWLDYLMHCSSQRGIAGNIKQQFLDLLLTLDKGFINVFYHTIPMVYLLDYTTGKYLTMSQSAQKILGFSKNEFIENGVGFTIDRYEKQHLHVFNSRIFPDRLNVLKGISPEEHQNYVFTYNLCMYNDRNEPVNLLQRNIFIDSDENGNPLASVGLVINLDHYRAQNPIVQTVDKITSSHEVKCVFKKVYYLRNEDEQFSKREKEILLWMAEGLTSKEIAYKLFISEGTVVVHRKNMLAKTNTPNVAALVAFAIRNGVI